MVRIFPNAGKYGVLSPNAGKYGPEKTPYSDTFHTVFHFLVFGHYVET